jgi:hypothetical protein
VPEPVGGHGELQRHEEAVLPWGVDAVLLDGLVHRLGIGHPLEEVVQDDVLVVLAEDPPGPLEVLAPAHQPVVCAQEGDVHLGDDEVLVVPGIADLGLAVELGVVAPPPPRQVVTVVLARRAPTALCDPANAHLVPVSRRGSAVDAVQPQGGRAGVAYPLPDLGPPERGQVGVHQIR